MTTKTIILDPAHGHNVKGKRSPDGKLLEYQYSRMFIAKLTEKLQDVGVFVKQPVTEEFEIGLTNRVKRYNRIDDAIVISIHLNAAGNGSKWMEARGFEVYTTDGETKSDILATVLFEAVKQAFPEMKMRSGYNDPNEKTKDPDREANFTVLMSKHPSILVELAFQDNKEDVEMILDPDWQTQMIDAFVAAIQTMIEL